MKTPISILLLSAILSVLAGCSTPKYRGEGQIMNTTSWYLFIRQPEYTIRLPAFGLNTNITQECDLGDMGFFRKTQITVSLQFETDVNWYTFKEEYSLGASWGDFAVANAPTPWRDVDKIQGRLSYRVVTETGKELLQSDKLLKDYRWRRASRYYNYTQKDGEIYDFPLTSAIISKGTNLKVWFKYTGDPSLTNRGEFVVKCEPR